MKKMVSVLLILLCVFSLSSCGNDETKDDFKIVTSFYPVYVTTLNLIDGAEDVSLVNITDTEMGCMHDYNMTADDMKKISSANLFIVSGLNMEAFVGKVSLGVPGLELLDCGEDVPHKLGEEEAEDPHYWMNIENTIAQTEKIRRTLCRLDPKNEAVYNSNAEEYTRKLNDLKAEAQERCNRLEKRTMAVTHSSFDYFAEEFGIEIIPLLPENSVSEKKETQLIAKMKLSGIETLFMDEGNKSDATLKAIKKETECTVVVLDTLTKGKIDETTKDAYLNAIRKDLDLLEEHLGTK